MQKFFKELTHDHDEVKDILKQMSESSDRAIKTREKLFKQLKQELIPHMKAEEHALYPALLKESDARKTALEALEEHRLAETVFQQLEKIEPKEELWGVKVKVLKDLIEHHIKEEEQEMFKAAKDALDKDQFETVMQTFQDEKQKIKEKLS